MATKALQARIVGAAKQEVEALRRVHRVFNELLPQMIQRYVRMRKGKYGPDIKRIAETMLSRTNTFAHGVMDGLSRTNWTSKLKDEWALLIKKYVAANGPLFEQAKDLGTACGKSVRTSSKGGRRVAKSDNAACLIVNAKFWHQVCDDSSAFIKSYEALLDDWRKERKRWLTEKKKWVAEHSKFMAFWENRYKAFEAECEKDRQEAQEAAGQKVTKKKRQKRTQGRRISRWHLWYEWLIAHPDILEWRGKAKAEDFKPVPEDIQKKIRKRNSRQDKYIPKFLDWIRENNPELKELERQRKFFLREFHHFKRSPTFTLPSLTRHPRWFTFEKDVFYKDVDFDKGTINILAVIEDENGIWSLEWRDFRIQCDKRLKPSHRARVFREDGRLPPYIEGKVGRKLSRPAASPEERLAGYAGAKLVFKKDSPHLVFTVIEQDAPRRARPVKVKGRKCTADNMADEGGTPLQSMKVLAIDLGVRHIGGYTIAEGKKREEGWVVTTIKKGLVTGAEIPELLNLRRHERQLRKQRRQRGKPVKAELSFIELQQHRTHMADDRFKKAANAMIELARKYDVKAIIFEKLDSLKPSAWDERWLNKQLRAMNRRQIVEAVRNSAPAFGFFVDDGTSPYLTSHVCSACHLPGWRFSIKPKAPYKEKQPRKQCEDYGYPIWDRGGHLFRCPHCGHKGNSDINAAGNLIAKFFGLWRKDVKRKDWRYAWTDDEGAAQSHEAKKLFAEWAEGVKQRKIMGDVPF